MLVLTRKIGESVVIGEDVYCQVVDVRGRGVQLAFHAPKSIPIHREEIQQRISQERQKDEGFNDMTTNESIVDRLIRQFKHGMRHIHNRGINQ